MHIVCVSYLIWTMDDTDLSFSSGQFSQPVVMQKYVSCGDT